MNKIKVVNFEWFEKQEDINQHKFPYCWIHTGSTRLTPTHNPKHPQELICLECDKKYQIEKEEYQSKKKRGLWYDNQEAALYEWCVHCGPDDIDAVDNQKGLACSNCGNHWCCTCYGKAFGNEEENYEEQICLSCAPSYSFRKLREPSSPKIKPLTTKKIKTLTK